MLDLINSIYAYLIIFALFFAYRIPAKYFLIVSAHLFLVFLTNGVLFDPGYMPDQFRYIHSASNIRASGFDLSIYRDFDINFAPNVSNAGLFFAMFPIPFLDSIYSISIINFMLYSFAFIFLYKKQILTSSTVWLYLFFPSYALYAAIGGRDLLIFLVMLLSFHKAYRGNFITSIIFALPLLFIKTQNFLIFMISLLSFWIIKKYYNKQFIKFILMFVSASILLILSMSIISLDSINLVRMNSFLEDGGIVAEYTPLNSYTDVIRYGIIGIFYTFLFPLPWMITNSLQGIQSIENIVIFIVIFAALIKLLKLPNENKFLLLAYIISHSAIYGLIISNYGSLSRYKFSFILIFLIYSLKLIYDETSKINNRSRF